MSVLHLGGLHLPTDGPHEAYLSLPKILSAWAWQYEMESAPRLPEYTAHSDLASGHLVQLFRGAVESQRVIKAYYPRTKVIPAKLQAFINCLKTRLNPGHAASSRARSRSKPAD